MKFSSNILRATVAVSFASSAYAENFGFAGQVYNEADFNQFDNMSAGDRILTVSKNAWGECLTDNALHNAIDCKAHIDSELEAMNLVTPIESVIIYSRRPDSPTSHAIVIPIDDDNMVVGKHGDGKIYYDFDWCVDKLEVMTDTVKIEESRKLLKPSKWSKMIAANKNVECTDVDNDGDLDVWHSKAEKVMGGDFETACSSPVGVTKIKETIAAGPKLVTGCQKIAPIDASGLSGVDACKLIKDFIIPYPNTDGKNIECWLSYKPGSPKLAQIVEDLTAENIPPPTKVKIYAMWNTKKVYETPLMHGPRSALGSA